MALDLKTQDRGGNWLLYDGECPFCSSYVRMVHLQENAGPIRLVDARERTAEYAEAVREGYDLDEGMLLKLASRYYFGKDCVHALALLTRQNDTFGRLNGWIFRSPRRSAAIYPILRAGRNFVLFLLGRTRINDL